MRITLAHKAPVLIPEWSSKNGILTPFEVTYGSNKKVWWIGKCGHEWQASVKNRVNGHGCPYCSGNRVLEGVNDLATMHPDLVCEWSDKNLPHLPSEYTSNANRSVWWKCNKCGEKWKARIADRVEGHGCPVCAGAKLVSGINDLATVRPDLAREWSTKNARAPNEFFPGSDINVWWHCEKCKVEWQGTIRARVRGRTCPECKKKYHGLSIHDRIMNCALENGAEPSFEDDSRIGIPLQYYFSKWDAAIMISKRTDYFSQEILREKARNRLCRINGIKLIRILYPGAKEFTDCICISRQDNSWEAKEAAVRTAFKIMGVT